MTITTELFDAAERTMHASGAKPKDAVAILNQLASEFGVECSVEGGLLSMKQNGQPASVGAILAAHRAKFPRSYYGESGDVTYKTDLQGDSAAIAKWIKEHSLAEWEQLPLNETSLNAHRAVTAAIPSSAMKRADYLRLSTAEKIKLTNEIGPNGIQKIMRRVR